MLLIGAFKILFFFIGLFQGIFKHCCRARFQSKDRLYQMYGRKEDDKSKRSWVVVTGGSDGVGLAMAKEAAKNYKFNVCIIGRNETKMQQKLNEIGTDVETLYLVADFAKMSTI